MAALNRILINTIATFTKNIAAQLFGLITGIILARYLGPDNYGKYSFAISFCYIFMVLSDFGLNDLYVRNIAADRSLAPKYFGASFVIKSFMASVSIVALYFSLNFLGYSSELILYTMIFSIHIFFIIQLNTILAIFRSYEKMEYNAYISIITGSVSLFFISFLVYLNQSLVYIISARVVISFFVFLVGVYFIRKYVVSPVFRINRIFISEIIKKSFPFLTIGLVHTLYFKVDIIMLSKLKGDIFVGYYTPAANDLFFGLFIIPITVSAVLYPIFSRQYKDSLEKMRKSINFSIKILAVLGVPISVGTFVLATQIIQLIFGPQYDRSVVILQIMAFAISFAFIREPLGYGIASIGRERFLMWINSILLLLNIMLNAVMIPIYAHVGAALTSIMCMTLSLFFIFYVLNRQVGGLFLLKFFVKPIIASFVMGIVVYYCRELNLIITILTGALVYVCLILLIRTFNEEEMAILKSILSRR